MQIPNKDQIYYVNLLFGILLSSFFQSLSELISIIKKKHDKIHVYYKN